MHFPSTSQALDAKIPKGRVIHNLDPTVPEKHYLKSYSNPEDLKVEYPSHTRAVHHVSDGVCSLGYAVSQAGARRLLNYVGLGKVDKGYDLLLGQFCWGSTGGKPHNCLTTQPPLFKHHRPAGPGAAMSDITDHGAEYIHKAYTDNIRWSVRMNLDVLLAGGTEFVDQYPDTDIS